MVLRFAVRCLKCSKIREVRTSNVKTWSGKCFICGTKLKLSSKKWPGLYENCRELKEDEQVVYKGTGMEKPEW